MLRIIVVCVIAVVLIGGLIVGIWAWRYNTAEVRGVIDAREDIMSCENRIDKYNYFFDLKAALEGYKGQLDQLYIQRSQLIPESPNYWDDLSLINTQITGVMGAFIRGSEEYNYNSQKDYTSGQFRDSDLPYTIPTSYESPYALAPP